MRPHLLNHSPFHPSDKPKLNVSLSYCQKWIYIQAYKAKLPFPTTFCLCFLSPLISYSTKKKKKKSWSLIFQTQKHWDKSSFSENWNSTSICLFFYRNKITAYFSSLKGDPSHSNWTVLDFYGIVKGVIIVAFTTMITLWIGLPWSGLFIISRPLVESSSVLHQLERWVICHWPPENSASSTLCYKFTSSCYTV